MKHTLCLAAPFMVVSLCAGALHAQRPATNGPTAILAPGPVLFNGMPDQGSARKPASLRPLRVAKWTVLVTSAGAGIYGFVQNSRADDRFRDLEAMCQAEQQRCSRRTADGAYEDSEFESLFDEVRQLDGRSHTALLLSQVGVASGVVLFLLDLGNVESPADIPFVPKAIRVGPEDGGRLSLGIQFSAGQ